MKKKSKPEYAPVTVETGEGKKNVVYFSPDEAIKAEPRWIRLWQGEKIVKERKPIQ